MHYLLYFILLNKVYERLIIILVCYFNYYAFTLFIKGEKYVNSFCICSPQTERVPHPLRDTLSSNLRCELNA